VQVAERPLVLQIGFGLDEGFPECFRLVFVGVGEFDGTFQQDAGFEGDDAVETPVDVNQGLDEGLFFFRGGGVKGEGVFQAAVVFAGVIGGQEDGAACESGFEGVTGRCGAAGGAGRSRAELGVGTVGI